MNQIPNLARVSLCSNQEKYLGLPAMVDKTKYVTFEAIKDRVRKIVNNLKNNFLSQVGREILLKLIIQALPTYSISMFLLPRKICKDITSIMLKFWWFQRQKNRRIQWRKWEMMEEARAKVRLGFKYIEAFNKTLLQNKYGGFCSIQIHLPLKH